MVTRRVLVALLTAVPLTACYSEHLVTTPGPYINQYSPDQALITRVDGTRSMLMAPKIFNDTIMAFAVAGTLAGAHPEQVMVALPQVQSITVKTLNKPRTYGLLIAGAGAVIGTAMTISGHGAAPNPNCNGKQVYNQTVTCRSRPAVNIPAAKLLGGLAHGLGALLGNN
jgi:hypothetical protein